MSQSPFPVIGFDAKRALCNNSGLGAFSRTLLHDLSLLPDMPKMRLYTPRPILSSLLRQLPQDLQDSLFVPLHRGKLYGDIWRAGGIVRHLRRDGVALFHGLSGELPRGLKANGIRSVVTIHDLIFLIHPEYYTYIDRHTYLRRYHRTLREADIVIAISDCTKRDILRHSQLRDEQVHVIYQGISQRHYCPCSPDILNDVRQRYHLPSQFILCVGTVEPRKNVLLAVRALASLPETIHIVVVGHLTPYARLVQKEAQRLGVVSRLHFLSHVPNNDLPAIYQQATAFVYPSVYEGFGIPIVEAISHGLPVVACTGSCLEEAGGPANIYIAPDDVHGMHQALSSLLASPQQRRSIVEASRNYITRFDNTTTAASYLSIYQQLLCK